MSTNCRATETAAADAPGKIWQPARLVRHKKRGTTYAVIGTAELQMATDLVDGSFLTIYQGEDGKWWARQEDEFADGRFEDLIDVTPTPPGVWARIEDFRGNPEGDPLVWWWNEDGSEKMATDEALLDGDGVIIGKSACGLGYYTHVMLAEFPEAPDVRSNEHD